MSRLIAWGYLKYILLDQLSRAENSNTTRHLAEFWMVEPEIAFANLMDNAALAQGMLKHVLKRC